MMEDDERTMLDVSNIADGWWELNNGETFEFKDMTDQDGKIWRIINYEYLGMTEFPPLICKGCDRILDEDQLLLRLEGDRWVVPHYECMSFIWYRERRVLE